MNKEIWKDFYERSIGNIAGACINSSIAILLAAAIYVFVLPDMNKKQYENTLLMAAVYPALNLTPEKRRENSRYKVYLHLKKSESAKQNTIENKISLLLGMHKYSYFESTDDFDSDSHSEVVYFDRGDEAAADGLANLVNLILPPGVGKPITTRYVEAKVGQPKEGEAGQLGLWLTGSN